MNQNCRDTKFFLENNPADSVYLHFPYKDTEYHRLIVQPQNFW